MLRKLKAVSNFLLESFMFSVAGVVAALFIPCVIMAVWVELFKEAKNEFFKKEESEPSEEV